MQKIAYLGILAFSLLILSSCEKDDICIAGDTPKLRIGFYDYNARENAKQPIDLVILGMDKSTLLNPMIPSDSNVFEVLIPLNPSQNNTAYYFVQNASLINEVLSGDLEALTFSYSIDPVYISKACGYIANYQELSIDRTIDPNWIKEISIENASITDENQIHVKIYF